jgi:hypothetical protein
MCSAQNNFVKTLPAAKKRSVGKIACGLGVAIITAAILFTFAPVLTGIITLDSDPVIRILQPQTPDPKAVPRAELVQNALQLINKDRADFGLPPVELSSNQAAQAHAEDVFSTKMISHWMTNGEKPYMTYTRYGGFGSVQQNVAIAGFDANQYHECHTNILLDCEKIEPVSTLHELEKEMMYNDADCCNNGHRDNILDPRHTHVSIGIVYDKFYLAFVENFENDYGLNVDVHDGKVRISGQLLEGELQQVSIYYDVMPTPAVYEKNNHMLSYSDGDLVATVVKPLPPGYYYEKPQGYTLIQANRWSQGNSVNVMFDLAPAVNEDGVYTLFTIVKDGGETFDATSYSVFVDTDS